MLNRYERMWHTPVGLMVVLLAVSALVFIGGCTKSSEDVSTTYSGTAVEGPAPDFSLTDQQGAAVSLSDFQGRIVVLAFLDPHCTDVCPLTALQFRQVHQALAGDSARVTFLAVNVNHDANSVAEAAAATAKWQMESVPEWHFLTRPDETLKKVWQAYGVMGGEPKPGKSGEALHTPGVYVIDQAGNKRWYISVPLDAKEWSGPTLSGLLLTHIRDLLKG